MEALINKISDAGLDVTSVTGEEAIIFWNYVRQHIATNAQEKAQCFIISSEYRSQLHQTDNSIEELRSALELLSLPGDSKLVLEIKFSLSEQLLENGQYLEALEEYVSSTSIAVDCGRIDAYVNSVLGLGNLCDAYGDYNRALRYYQKIDTLDHAITSRSLRLRYKLYMLAAYLQLGRLSAAEDLIRECEEISILVSDKMLTGQILLYQAKLFRLQGEQKKAIQALGNVKYTAGNIQSSWLSNMIRLELANCLNDLGRKHLANWTLETASRRIKPYGAPFMALKLSNTLAEVYEKQQNYERALVHQKRGFRIESDLMKKIPISELGASQLRRLSRFELQLKLILSELENQELKETTESQKNAVAQLQQDVYTDPLTSLHNRRWLDMKLKDLLQHDNPFALVVVDIDHFKSINDELSHLVGDKAIVNVSRELAAHFRFHGASCVRFGGEEFLVILENVNVDQAEMHAQNYRQRIYQFDWAPILGERGLTVSIGITMHRDGENTQRTFYRADKALYRAKANGRNQVCVE